jgi:hypothetical protein
MHLGKLLARLYSALRCSAQGAGRLTQAVYLGIPPVASAGQPSYSFMASAYLWSSPEKFRVRWKEMKFRISFVPGIIAGI